MLRRLLLLLVLVTSSACAHNLAPTDDALLTPPVEIVAPVLEESLGALALTNDGRWAFKTSDRAADPTWERGSVVAFGDLDETRRHLFVVLSTHRWGAFLQRLDADPLVTNRSGSLVPLGRLDRQVAKRWKVCAGKGAPAEHACLNEAPLGTRWDIYEASGETIRFDADEPDELVLPARRDAQVHMSALGNVTIGEADGDWVAVPRRFDDRLARSRVVLSESCKGRAAADSLLTDTVVAAFDAPVGFFETEALAYAHGADAFVVCGDDRATLHVPGLTRRGWSRVGGDEVGPFLTAFAPPTVELENTDFQRLIAFAGALGAGDIGAADFFLEQMLSRRRDGSIEDLGRDTMQIAVEAGRVEGAIRQGSGGTSTQWNRENDPRWSLGFAAIEDAIGKPREFIERRSELDQTATRAKDDAVLSTIYWYQAVETLSGGGGMPAVEKLSESLGEKELDALKSAVVWRAAQKDLITPEDAMKAVTFDDTGAAFVAAATGEVTPLPCEADCQLDVYGRRFLSLTSLEGLVPRLSRVGNSDFSPGYRARISDVKDPALLVALLPHLSDKLGAETALIGFAVDCEADVDQALELARELPDDLSVAWFMGQGRRAYCKSLPAFIASSKGWIAATRDETRRRQEVVATMLNRRLFRMRDGIKMGPGADFLSELAAGSDACERWNVALAVAHLRAGRTESANAFTERALSCSSVGPIATRMAAFVNFDRTRSTSSSFEPDVRRAVKLATQQVIPGDACVGLQPMEWGWRHIVSDDMESVVRAISVPSVEEDSVMLATASRTLLSAQRAQVDLVAAMKAGDAKAAQAALAAWESDVAAIDNKPGIRRALFVRTHLVGPAPAEGLEPKPPAKRSELAAAWADPAAFLAGENPRDEIAMAIGLLIEPAEAWSARAQRLSPESRESLCALPEEPR